MKETLKNVYIKSLAKKIRDNGVKCEDTLESILENINALKEKGINYDTEYTYLPLSIKKILLFILFPNRKYSFINKVTEDGFFISECKLWLDGNSKDLDNNDILPDGYGFHKEHPNTVNNSSFLAEIDRVKGMEAMCRSLALSKAIVDAGIGLNLFEEDAAETTPTTTNRTVEPAAPPIPMDDAKPTAKRRGRPRKSDKKAENDSFTATLTAAKNEETSKMDENKATETNPTKCTTVAENPVYTETADAPEDEDNENCPIFSTQDSDNGAETVVCSDESTTTSTIADNSEKEDVEEKDVIIPEFMNNDFCETNITYEQALLVKPDIGAFNNAKNLGEVLKTCRKNILWMYNHGSSNREALKVIIDNNKDLSEKLEEIEESKNSNESE